MADAGKYRLNGHMVVRDEVPPGVDPLLIRTTQYEPGDVVTLTEEQASRLSGHQVRSAARGVRPAIEPYEEDEDGGEDGGDEASAASVPSLSGKDEGK